MDYTQIKVSVSPELALAFKTACASADDTMTSALSKFMADYCHTRLKPKVSDFSTRRRRRAAISRLLRELELIKDAEIRYIDRIPENLQGSIIYDNAEQAVSLMDEAAEILASAYMVP